MTTPRHSGPTQVELFREGVTDADVGALRAHLLTHGWQTRKQLTEALGWSERKIRDVAELCGTDVVRGQLGFKLTAQLTREETGIAIQASDAAISQGKKQIRYGVGLRRKIHEVVG